jgi:flagellar motor switch protein FliG
MSGLDYERLTGPEKTAVLLLSLPQETACEYLARLADDEVERILGAVSRVEAVPSSVQERILAEFQQALGQSEPVLQGGRAQAAELAQSALGPARAQRILERLAPAGRGVEQTLRPFAPEFVGQTLADEHPQVIALVLSQLPVERGAPIIAALAEDVRPEVVTRLASLESVAADVMADIEQAVAALFGEPPAGGVRVGGTDAAAKLLNQARRQDAQAILESVDARSPEVAGEIRKRMLTFDDLAQLDKRGFQALLREVPVEDLVVALKTASEAMRERIFSNVSSRAADQIREEAELLGAMKLSEVERVQQGIVETARRLESEGKLTIGIGGADDVMV